jgi:hypothetical protein
MLSTTQQTKRTEAGYLAARAAFYDAQAASEEAAAAKYDADPWASEECRADMVAFYREAAAKHRALAQEDREELAGLCVCGGLGRLGDSLCRCQSTSLLAAMNHSMHAEASHG